MRVGDVVTYVGQYSPWRVIGVDALGRTVSIELVRNSKHLRYNVPADRLRVKNVADVER